MERLYTKITLVLLGVLLPAFTADSRHNRDPSRQNNSFRRMRPVKIMDHDIGNANDTADIALQVVKKTMLSEEPVVANGIGPCSKCVVTGVSQIRRIGPATSIELSGIDRRRIKLTIELPLVNATCECSIGYILYLYGKVDVSVSNVVVYLDVIVDVDKEETENIPRIRVVSSGTIDADFDGYGILGNIVDKFTFFFRSLLGRIIRRNIYTEIPRVIQNEQRHHLYHLGFLKK